MLYDVFICHASEDKDELVRPLAFALQKLHLEVWYDEFSLIVGDSLRESIDKGLAKCRYGIVVISPNFFEKNWTKRELNGLVAREMSEGNPVILPIWHKIRKEEILKHSPPLADISAINSALGMQAICSALMRRLRPDGSPLIIARDELLSFGLNPPVVTDEWWLDIIEASNRIPNGGVVVPENTQWGRWTFPLPWGVSGKDRGIRLAWTAMQMKWEEAAEEKKITQITRPEEVLNFINSYPGLKDICHEFPSFLASYAPQLTIKGFGGEFEKDFARQFILSLKKYNPVERKSTTGQLSPECDEELALRHPTFGNYDPARIACQYVQGEIFGPSIKFYDFFDYIVWLLSNESKWLPSAIRNYLILGMKEWAVWPSIDLDWNGDAELKFFLHGLLKAKSYKQYVFTKKAKKSSLALITRSLKKIDVKDDADTILENFLNFGFIEAYFIEKGSCRR